MRRATTAYVPCPRGSGNTTSGPGHDDTTASSTACHDATVDGSRPSTSNRRSAPVVSPSPQHLSRGKRALSTSTTSRPARARVMAAAAPAGPPPTTTTSAVVTCRGYLCLANLFEALGQALHQHVGVGDC